jgi:nicotinamide riboside transporter PnuC
MNFTIWFFVEWIGTIVALSGSVVIASQKISPVTGWKLWALSHLFHISLFVHTGQFGLLYLQLVGFSIALMGLWQWSYQKEINPKLMKLFSSLSFAGLSVALVLIANIMISPEFKKLEWIGALLSVSAALLLASNLKNGILLFL